MQNDAKKKVSFIVATYNGEKYLNLTINSALNQKNTDVEVVIIDDGSKDDSYRIAQEIALNDSRVISIKNEKNIGFCKTVNKGITLANGEYIIILDQDDIVDEYHCDKMLKHFDEDTSMVFCDNYLIDSNGSVFFEKDRCLHRDISIRDLIKGNCIPVQGLLIRKSIIESVGGYPENPKFPNYGEYHTWIRIAETGKIVFCDDVKAYYRRHDSNMINTFKDKKVKKRLMIYMCACRLQLLKSKKVSIKDKVYVFFSVLKNQVSVLFL